MPKYVLIDNIALDAPITSLTQMLDLQGVSWRLDNKPQYHELWVEAAFKGLAEDIVRHWRKNPQGGATASINNPLKPLFQQMLQFPFTYIVMILCVLGGLVVYAKVPETWFFNPIEELTENSEWWRLITPVFLHFSWLHLVFNLLFFWYFGRAIEHAKGWLYLAILLVLLGVASNLIQYWYTPSIYFGGLSGVDYGIVGFLALYQQFVNHPVLRIQNQLFIMLVAWLIAGMTGVFSSVGIHIANGAHLGGLLLGCACGALAGMIDRGNKDAR